MLQSCRVDGGLSGGLLSRVGGGWSERGSREASAVPGEAVTARHFRRREKGGRGGDGQRRGGGGAEVGVWSRVGLRVGCLIRERERGLEEEGFQKPSSLPWLGSAREELAVRTHSSLGVEGALPGSGLSNAS